MDSGAQCYRRYLDGDDDAFIIIIDEYKYELTLYLRTLTGDIVRAEELMEDTFAKLFINKPKFAGKSSFKTWLFAIARNMAYDDMRRASHISPTPTDELEVADEEEDVEANCIKDERKRALYRALGELSLDQRQALHLFYFEDMSCAEIAAVMKKNVPQVKNLLSRGRASLRQKLEEWGFSYEN